MAEDIGEKIVERLKQEGQLTRNTGTNSIKAVRTELAKFNDVFQSINTNLMQQTQILRETLQIQLEEAGKNERSRQLAEAERSSSTPQPISSRYTQGGSSPFSESTSGGGLSGLLSLFGAGGFGGAVGAGATALLGALRKPLRTALLTVIAPSVGALIGSFVEEGLLELGASTDAANAFGEAANLGGLFGMIGLAFGKRMGLVAAAGGVAASFGDEVLDSLGLDKDKIISILGTEMKTETLAQGILGALGASVTAAALSPSFRASLTNFFKDSVDTNGNPLSRFPRRRALLGATIGSAVLGAYIAYGDDLKTWIEDQDFPAPVEGVFTAGTDIAGMAATGASFGLMFGPQGALVGASIGAAVGIGMTLFNWINDRRARNQERIQEEIDEMNRILNDAEERSRIQNLARDLATMTPEQQNAATTGMSGGEIRSLNRLITPILELTEELNYLRSEAQPFELQGQTVPASISNRMIEVQEELIRLLREQHNNMDQRLAEMETTYGSQAAQNPDYQKLIENYMNVGSQLESLGAQGIITVLPTGSRSYRTGTKGFRDFGNGSFAVLHGREAVVPETTPAGQFLKNYFDENWQPLMSRINEISSAAVQSAAIVNFTPITMTPITNNNVMGGSSSTTITSINTDRSDLDALSRPGGVQ